MQPIAKPTCGSKARSRHAETSQPHIIAPSREDAMIRQYYAQRCRGGDNPLRVGVIPSGAIFYIQDEGWRRDGFRGAPICRNPWIVEGYLNDVLCAARRNRDTGRWEDAYIAGRSDMATVRSLRDGRRHHVAVRILILHEDEGLRRDSASYPDLPQIRSKRPSIGPVTGGPVAKEPKVRFRSTSDF
jgi:hypothetical protein